MGMVNCLRINTSKIVYETIGGEVIIINMENGNYYSLNPSATEIWGLIENDTTISEIVDEIAVRYQEKPEEIKKDIVQWFMDLREEDLIVPVEKKGQEDRIEIKKRIELNENAKKLRFEKPVLQKYTDMREMLLLDPIHEVDETGWPALKVASKQKD